MPPKTTRKAVTFPDWAAEEALWAEGAERVAGVDEAGRGPLAGPVVAAAVVLPRGWQAPQGLNDSKKMKEPARYTAFDVIRQTALGWRIAVVSAAEVDSRNILQATLWAMQQSVMALGQQGMLPDAVLVDGDKCPTLPMPTQALIGGDGKSLSIAAASVLAKVARDRLMLAYHRRYPQYGWDKHKGYGTKAHREAILAHGPSPLHRRTFLRKLLGETP